MAKIIIDKDRCKGCFFCISFCPMNLIKKSGKLNRLGLNCVEFSLETNLNKGGVQPTAEGESKECLGCCLCAIICPDCCIEVYK